MTQQLRWGILGTGGIASLQAADLVSNGFSVAAVGSRSKATAAEFATRFGIPTAHGSYAELVADPTVDVVYVATPHPFHAEHALLALNAGKHVLVEKPFTMTAAQAIEVVSRAEELRLVVLEAMWTRYLPHMVRIRQLVRGGDLGTVRSVIADHNQNLPRDPLHRINNPDLGGGALLDLGIYPVSFSFDILGAPTDIIARGTMTTAKVDRQNAMIFVYDDEAQALLQSAIDLNGPTRAVIVGTEGRIEIDSVWYAASRFTRYDAADTPVEVFENSVAGRGMQYQALEMERLVTAGILANDILPPAQSVEIMHTLDEIRRQIGLKYAVLGEV